MRIRVRRSNLVTKSMGFALLVALTGVLAQVLLSKPYYVGMVNDDAAYLLSAFSLINHGRCPVCQQVLTQGQIYHIGWPLLMAPLVPFALDQVSWYQGLSLLLTLGSALLLGFMAKRSFGWLVGYLLAASFLVSTGCLLLSLSTLSEPLFAFQICALLWVSHGQKSLEPKALAVTSLLSGWCVITRTEGVAVLAAVVGCFLLRKKWGSAVVVVVTSLLMRFLENQVIAQHSLHFGQVAEFFEGRMALWNYASSWGKQQLSLLSKCYLGSSAAGAQAVVFVLSLLVLAGWWRWWRNSPGFGPWFGLALPAALFLWPYPQIRYWYALYPIWLLGLAFVLPKRGRVPLFGFIIIGQLFFATNSRSELDPSGQNLYLALAATPTDSVVTCLYDCRAHLLGHRRTASVGSVNSLAELLVFMATHQSRILLWERYGTLISDVKGESQGGFSPALDPWVERSPLLETLTQNPAGVIRQLKVPEQALLQAFDLYRESFLTPDAKARVALLDKCLQTVPHFPGAESLRALSAADVPGTDLKTICRELSDYVRRYPYDFPTIFNGLPVFERAGLPAEARALAEEGRREAVRLGFNAEARALTAYLENSPGMPKPNP